MPYTNEDKLYDEIALINEKLRLLTNEVVILRKQIFSVQKDGAKNE